MELVVLILVATALMVVLSLEKMAGVSLANSHEIQEVEMVVDINQTQQETRDEIEERCRQNTLAYMRNTQDYEIEYSPNIQITKEPNVVIEKKVEQVITESRHAKFLRLANIIEGMLDKETLVRKGKIYGKKSLFVTQIVTLNIDIIKKIRIDYENEKFYSVEVDKTLYKELSEEAKKLLTKKEKERVDTLTVLDVTDTVMKKWNSIEDMDAYDLYMIDLGEKDHNIHPLVKYLKRLALETEYDNAIQYYRGLLNCGDTSQIIDSIRGTGKIFNYLEAVNFDVDFEYGEKVRKTLNIKK